MLLQFKSSARKSGITLTACTTPSSRSPPSGSGTWWQVSLYHVHDSTYHVLLLLLAYFPRAYFPRAYFPCAYFPRDYQLLHAYYCTFHVLTTFFVLTTFHVLLASRLRVYIFTCLHDLRQIYCPACVYLARMSSLLLYCILCAHVFYVTVLHPLRACLRFSCMKFILCAHAFNVLG